MTQQNQGKSSSLHQQSVKITVLTATLNAESHIKRLIKSLSNQTDNDFEWLVIDGESTDKTVDLLKSENNLSLRIIVSRDFGIYDALNKGIKTITEGYYLVVGADDVLFPNAIKNFKDAILHDNADIISAAVQQAGKINYPRKRFGWLYGLPGVASSHAVGLMIKVNLHKQFGLYSKKLPIAADQLFVKTALNRGATIRRCRFIAGEFSTEGTSGGDPIGLLTELFRVQIATEKWPLIQLAIFILRLLKFYSISFLYNLPIRKKKQRSKSPTCPASIDKTLTPTNKIARIHLTNLTGTGATQLALSLLPSLSNDPDFFISDIYLPEKGLLHSYHSSNPATRLHIYNRLLPNILSRFLECTLLSSRFNDCSPILVLGDIPLRCKCPQTVFVQTPHLIKNPGQHFKLKNLKYSFSRLLFDFNKSRVDSFIVQTNLMRDSLASSYPSIASRIHVLPQPVPAWLLDRNLKRKHRFKSTETGLQLFYPAAHYPHKNHDLLAKVSTDMCSNVDELLLTINNELNPARHLQWIKCVGHLAPEDMIAAYSSCDGVLFLSKQESYGFPLIEAMFIGLPVVCPNLPYAHVLCGETAIYFDPDNSLSLCSALQVLHSKLQAGWWPDWTDAMAKLPRDWDSVARHMLSITDNF